MDNWYFCEDQLPDVDDDYLVIWYAEDDLKHRYYEIQQFAEGQWWVHIPQAHGKKVVIYAWQALPAMPKEA